MRIGTGFIIAALVLLPGLGAASSGERARAPSTAPARDAEATTRANRPRLFHSEAEWRDEMAKLQREADRQSEAARRDQNQREEEQQRRLLVMLTSIVAGLAVLFVSLRYKNRLKAAESEAEQLKARVRELEEKPKKEPGSGND